MATLVSPTTRLPGSSNSPRLHLDFLDGLRAVAALLVVVNHLWGDYTHQVLRPGLEGFLTNWLENGHFWVDVFIVLSGFCLMLPVARSRVLRGGWRTFYKSRARRILPPLYAAIAFALVLALHHGQVSKRDLLSNIFLLQDILQSRTALDGPLWSVAVEWKIYFLFPVFVWLWQRFGPPAVLITSAVFSAILLALYTASHLVAHMSFACPWYVFLFSLGMISADFARRSELPKRAQFQAWLMLGSALVLVQIQAHVWPAMPGNFLDNLRTPVSDSLTGLAVATLLFLLTRMTGSQTKNVLLAPLLTALSWHPLVFIGTFAYSIYLIHVLLVYDIKDHLISLLDIRAPGVIIPMDIAIVLPLAYLFHLAFERPFMSKPGTKIKTEAQAEIAAVVSPAP